jgi:CheY-like chemotaxis protein
MVALARKSSILVLDDDGEVCALLSSALADLGYKVHCAYDCATALDFLRHADVNIALLDLSVPGEGTIQQVIAAAHDRNAKVIVMSGAIDADEQLAALGERVLRKPFRIADLKSLPEDRASRSEITSASGSTSAQAPASGCLC